MTNFVKRIRGETSIVEGVARIVARHNPSSSKFFASSGVSVKFHELSVVSLNTNRRPVCGRSGDLILAFGNRVCGCGSLEGRLVTGNRGFCASASDRILIRNFRR